MYVCRLPVLNSRRGNSMELTEASMASWGKPSLTQSYVHRYIHTYIHTYIDTYIIHRHRQVHRQVHRAGLVDQMAKTKEQNEKMCDDLKYYFFSTWYYCLSPSFLPCKRMLLACMVISEMMEAWWFNCVPGTGKDFGQSMSIYESEAFDCCTLIDSAIISDNYHQAGRHPSWPRFYTQYVCMVGG